MALRYVVGIFLVYYVIHNNVEQCYRSSLPWLQSVLLHSSWQCYKRCGNDYRCKDWGFVFSFIVWKNYYAIKTIMTKDTEALRDKPFDMWEGVGVWGEVGDLLKIEYFEKIMWSQVSEKYCSLDVVDVPEKSFIKDKSCFFLVAEKKCMTWSFDWKNLLPIKIPSLPTLPRPHKLPLSNLKWSVCLTWRRGRK